MSENTRVYRFDEYTSLELVPVGTVSVFGVMQQEQLTNYAATLSVMGITIMKAENAAQATMPEGMVGKLFMDRFTAEIEPEHRSSLSGMQSRWYNSGTAERFRIGLKEVENLEAYEVR